MATVKIFNHHFRTPFIALLLVEAVVLYSSVFVGEYLRFGQLLGQEKIEFLELKAFIYTAIMMASLVAMGQYQLPNGQRRHYFPYIVIRNLVSFTLGIIGLTMVYYLWPEILLGRGLLAYSLCASFVGLVLVRLVFYHTVDGRRLRRRVLVMGAGELASNLLDNEDPLRAVSPRNASYIIHGFVAIDDETIKVPEQYLVKPGQALAEYCSAYQVDEIVLCMADRRNKMPVEALFNCKLSNIDVIDFVAFWEREKSMIQLEMMSPSWMIFCEGCKQSAFGKLLNRLFDVVVSLLMLTIMLPVLVLTMLLIFVESGMKGPIFYRQTRVGLNGVHFQLLKFRSMIVDAEKDQGAQWASENDRRVTRVGSFIRKVRIDELPQLLNILRGDMSIVGPRPERPEFVADLEKKIPFYSARHRVKPGLAGWAQLKYAYGANEQDAKNKLKYDLYYIKNQSLLMDLLVLLQTVEVVVLGKGAR